MLPETEGKNFSMILNKLNVMTYLVGKFIRTLFTKTNRRCHVSKHFIHFFIMNSTPAEEERSR